jgi:hypothetical protein
MISPAADPADAGGVRAEWLGPSKRSRPAQHGGGETFEEPRGAVAVSRGGSWVMVRRCQDDVINPGNSGKVGGLNQLTADKNI